jgi:hypothetical protein
MNQDSVTTVARPRSVTVIAIFFGLLAAYIGYEAATGLFTGLFNYEFLHQPINWVRPIPGLSVATFYGALTVGLWRLSSACRILALMVAALHTLATMVFVCVDPKVWPPWGEPREPDIALWLGAIIGVFFALSFLFSPIFVLTRPAVVAAFERRESPQNQSSGFGYRRP